MSGFVVKVAVKVVGLVHCFVLEVDGRRADDALRRGELLQREYNTVWARCEYNSTFGPGSLQCLQYSPPIHAFYASNATMFPLCAAVS
jgi:hypothetical protein